MWIGLALQKLFNIFEKKPLWVKERKFIYTMGNTGTIVKLSLA